MLDTFQVAKARHTLGLRQAGEAFKHVISESDFNEAYNEIRTWSGYAPTPLLQLPALAQSTNVEKIFYKHEGSRFGLGSFKALGGAYAAANVIREKISTRVGHDISISKITSPEYADLAAKITLVTATDGNHGRSVAWGARRLGSPCRIYIHAEVSSSRAQAMRDLGAEVIRVMGDYDASVAATRREAQAYGWTIVSDTSWTGYIDIPRQVMAGYGVMAREVCETMKTPPSHVFLQGGVGGLAAAVAAYFRQAWRDASPHVVVVEPELAPCLFESAENGKATQTKIVTETLMAGLSCGEPSQLAWHILAEEASDFLTIPESLVGPAVRLMARPLAGDTAIEAGESGIAGLAGFVTSALQAKLREKIQITEASRILLIGSEGITDPEIYTNILDEN